MALAVGSLVVITPWVGDNLSIDMAVEGVLHDVL